MKPGINSSIQDSAGGVDDASFDSSILAFGGSASVNADLRRSIKKEIDEIDASMAKTKKETKVENAVSAELKKGIMHAVRESRTLSQRSEQTLDALKLNHEVSQGLKTTMQTQILSPVVNHNPDKSDPSSGKTFWDATREDAAITRQTFKKLYQEVENATQKLKELTQKKKDIESDSTLELVEEYNLRLEEKRASCASAAQVLKDERDRLAALKATRDKENAKIVDLEANLEHWVSKTL